MTRSASRIAIILILSLLLPAPGGLPPHRGAPAAGVALANSHLFVDSGQALGNAESHAVALGDVDGDGDLDAVVANSDVASRVWVNQGGGQGGPAGQFASGQALGAGLAADVALGDVDGDGDLDVFLVSALFAGTSQVWLNQGGAQGGLAGQFADSGQDLGGLRALAVALGDMDGDGDLDAVVAMPAGPAALGDGPDAANAGNAVWLNNGSGTFSDSGQSLGGNRQHVALADLDGDGDLDAFFASNGANTVWLNNGAGTLSDSGQSLGSANSSHVALADLNGNGHVDAFVANSFPQGNHVYINNGNGSFTDSGQTLGTAAAYGVALTDVNGDGAIDASGATQSQGVQVWLNNSSGTFTGAQVLGGGTTTIGVAVGDLDGDGDADIFAANAGTNRVWFNQLPSPSGTDLEVIITGDKYVSAYDYRWVSVTVTVRNLGAEPATGVTVDGDGSHDPLTGRPGFGDGSQGQCASFDEYDNCLSWLFGDLAPGMTATVFLWPVGGVPFYSEHAAIVKEAWAHVVVSGMEADPNSANNVSHFAFYFFFCIDTSCYVEKSFCDAIRPSLVSSGAADATDAAGASLGPVKAGPALSNWLNTYSLRGPLRSLQDFVIDLVVYYLVRDQVLMGTADGQHYVNLYNAHQAEIGDLLEADPDLEAEAIATLQLWEPNLWALINGSAGSTTITTEQVQAVDGFLTNLAAVASPALQQAIAEERARLGPLDAYAGMTMDEARGIVVGYGLYLPLVARP